MSRRVLVVAYFFPPLGGIASLRIMHFASELEQFGWEPTVLAPANGAYYHDPGLHFPEQHVIRSRSIELSRSGKVLLRAGGSDTAAATAGGLRALPRAVARRYLYFPDSQVGWYPAATVAGLRALRGGRFDAVYSSAFPVSAHVIARTLRRRGSIPWLAEFRDPWSEGMDADDPRRRRARKLEASLAREASAVAMTSPSWAQEHGARWGRPVDVLPNGYGPPAPQADAPGDFVVAHLGSFYPDRQDLSAAWTALARLRRDGSLGEGLRLRFVGELPAALGEQLRAHGLDDVTEVTGFVTEQQALASLASASVVLAAGPSDARSQLQGWVPAKLFDYLATSLPIVWVGETPNDGATLLEGQDGCFVVGVGDVDGAAAALLAAREGPRHRERDLTGLSRRERTGQLAALLDRVVAG